MQKYLTYHSLTIYLYSQIKILYMFSTCQKEIEKKRRVYITIVYFCSTFCIL